MRNRMKTQKRLNKEVILMMISVWNLLWIIPLSMVAGVGIFAIVASNGGLDGTTKNEP